MSFNFFRKWTKNPGNDKVPNNVKNCSRLQVRYRDGLECEIHTMKLWCNAGYMWLHTGTNADVLEYRVMK